MNQWKRLTAVCLAAAMMLTLFSCGSGKSGSKNLIEQDEEPERVVNLFSPMEKTSPNLENAARSAFDKTIALAEERLGVSVAYRTYTAENYQDKTYDDVVLDRVRSNMDDIYMLNPDVLQILGEEGQLLDLSGGVVGSHLIGQVADHLPESVPIQWMASWWEYPRRWWPTACLSIRICLTGMV